MPELEAIQESRKVSAYLQTEEQTNAFVAAAVDLKRQQKRLIDGELKLIEDSSRNRKQVGEHPVLPSKAQISLLAANALENAIEGKVD